MEADQRTTRPLVEICVGTLSDALAAAAAGADRLELCSAAELGGLTPSTALLEQVLDAIDRPVVVLIRPRAGGFCYRDEEFKTAVRDAEIAIERGAAGIAFGFLNSSRRIDGARCRELVTVADKREAVFHRAFDFVVDPLAGADELIELGIKRVLTSGGQATALAGAALIRKTAERSAQRLEVMPGGGITAENVVAVLQQTGCQQIHAGASRPDSDGSLGPEDVVKFYSTNCLEHGRHRAVDGRVVANLIAQLHA